MIPKDNGLIRIYFLICDCLNELQHYCGQFSNNVQPEFTNQEIMTIYLYVMQHEGHSKTKHIHRFTSECLKSWFPKLGSYQAFNNRLNRLAGAFNRLVEMFLISSIPSNCILEQRVLDSMPKINCSGKPSANVAPEVADKGYCSTKSLYCHGMKLHMLRFRRAAKLPHPEQILFTPASVNDTTVYKQAWSTKGLMIHAFG